MSGGEKVLAELRGVAEHTATHVRDRFREETRPRIAALLADEAAIAVRRAFGEDVRLAQAAVAASRSNLLLQEEIEVAVAGRDVAIAALGIALRAALGGI